VQNNGQNKDIGMEQEIDKHQFFEQAASALMDRMYAAAMRFTRNAADAEDLLATTLEKAWNNLDSLDDRNRFDGWAMRILSNTYIRQWRREKRRQDVFDDDTCTHELDDKDCLYARLHQPFLLWWGTPEQKFINNLLADDIQNALNSITDVYRDVVLMVEVMGFTYDEVAIELQVPVGTVRSRLNRGRRLLQNALWQNARDAGLTTRTTANEVN
jgi:RNA polymerase sigma factor (sigma-70 family)